MTSPVAQTAPLRLYLPVEDALMRQMVADLSDARREATRRLTKLADRDGVGATVRRAQLGSIRRELLLVQQALWLALGQRVRQAGQDVADAAAEAVDTLDRALYGSVGQRMPEALARAHQAYAREVVNTYWSRLQNGISLSDQVYKSKALSQKWVDRAVNRVILHGGSWRDIARAVTPMIDPNVKGGVSYAARRLGRTELNNAFHTSQIRTANQNPWVTGAKWNLSRSHPKADVCDQYATEVHYRGGEPGVYPKADIPRKPHPQCYCYVTQTTVSEEEFLDRLMKGDFDDPTEPFDKTPSRAALPQAG